jgi:hypothetical protein
VFGRNLLQCRLFGFVPYLVALFEHLEHNQDTHVFSRYLVCFREVLLAFQFITACSLLINGDDFGWTQSASALRCSENKQMTYFCHNLMFVQACGTFGHTKLC